jgi:gliding motility-associated-like protein
MQKTTILLLLILVSSIASAQVDAEKDATITAGLPVKLSAVYEGYFGTLVTVHDDDFAGPFDIGFDFTFYGETASQFMIGANGVVSFNLSQGAYRDPVSIPNNKMEKAIYGPYQDYFSHGSTNSNNVYYKTVGTAPDRKLIVGWCEAPMYNCNDQKVTFQIVLFETGKIENHIINKPECTYLLNKATQGLNYNFDKGIAVPGRNSSSWTAAGESWEFLPDGTENYTVNQKTDFSPEVIVPKANLSISWYAGSYPGGEVISNSTTLIVNPTETTSYFAEITLCGGTKYYDEVKITTIPLPTAFRPESNIEQNRVFNIFADPVDNIQNFEMYIYDRWGKLVFDTNDISQGWDGEGNNGQLCAAGVYVWVIYFETEKSKLTNKGSVTLVR